MAAVVIQSQARTFMARRRFLEAKDSAIKMQAQMRMYLAKGEVERREHDVLVVAPLLRGALLLFEPEDHVVLLLGLLPQPL